MTKTELEHKVTCARLEVEDAAKTFADARVAMIHAEENVNFRWKRLQDAIVALANAVQEPVLVMKDCGRVVG